MPLPPAKGRLIGAIGPDGRFLAKAYPSSYLRGGDPGTQRAADVSAAAAAEIEDEDDDTSEEVEVSPDGDELEDDPTSEEVEVPAEPGDGNTDPDTGAPIPRPAGAPADHPLVGAQVSFTVGGETYTGLVRAVGPSGVTVEVETGQHHKVLHGEYARSKA